MADDEPAVDGVSVQSGKKIKNQPAKPPERFLAGEDLKKKAEEYNRAAIDLFEQGKYPEAQELWEKAIRLMDNPGSGYADVLDLPAGPAVSEEPRTPVANPSLAWTDSDIDKKYQIGMWLLEQKEYAKARQIFEEVQQMQPGYKNTANYLTVINELTQGPGQSPGSEAVALPESEPVSEGPAGIEGEEQEPAEEADSGKEETPGQEAAEEEEQKRLEELEQKVEPVYARAVEQYEHEQFAEAKIGFNQVEALYPGYALTEDYLARVDDDIREAEEQRVQQERRQREETSKKEQEEFQKAVRAKQMVYRRQQAAKAEKFYRQAIEAYKNRKLDDAENDFRKALVLSPDYKLTEKYLERIRQDRMEEERLYQEQQRQLDVLGQADKAGPATNAAPSPEASVSAAYTEGVALFNQKKYSPAREKFLQVAQLYPEYKSTVGYLKRIDLEENRQRELLASQQSSLRETRQEKHVATKAQAKNITQEIAEAPQPAVSQAEKKMREREQIRQDRERARKFKQIVGREYRDVVTACKNRQWEAAAQKLEDFENFLAAEDKDGLYQKSYAARTTRLRKNIQTQQQVDARTPRHGSKETLVKLLPPATPVSFGLLESTELAPSDDVRVLRRQQQQIQKERRKIHSAIDAQIDRSYVRAVDLYAKGYYRQSGEFFEAIDRASPAFKKTRNYLADINSRLATAPSVGVRASGAVIVADPIYVRPRGHIVSGSSESLEAQPR